MQNKKKKLLHKEYIRANAFVTGMIFHHNHKFENINEKNVHCNW